METQKLISELRDIVSPRVLPDEILYRRKPCVAVARAQYGAPSSVVIEFEGTPARCPIIVSRFDYHWSSRDVFVNGRKVPIGRRKQRLCELVDRYLAENMPRNLLDDFDTRSTSVP